MGAGQKRRREELARVAEMVMVLAVAGEARGGIDPTPAERALAAEARGKLAAAVEEVARPRELVTRDAVCALVEDLGLARDRDPAAMGYHQHRASIADRVLLTQRKMEEVQESYVHSTTNMAKTTSSSAITGSQQGASKSTEASYVKPGAATVDQLRHRTPSGELSVHKQSVLPHHKEIAMKVEWILFQPSNHSSWAAPSTEYMNTQLDCQICKVNTADMETLLVCDACEKGMHLKCLQRWGNQVLAKTEWYCPQCLALSKGKLLPPKYGKVKRTFIAPKTSMTSGVAQPSLQFAAESPTKKDCSEKAEANKSATNQNFDYIGSALHKSSAFALDTTRSKSLSISGAGPQKENVKCDETSFMKMERNGQPYSGIHTETAKPFNEGHSSGASTYSSSNLSGGSHTHTESSSVNSVDDSTVQSTGDSAFKHLNHSSIVSSKENCEGKGTSHQHSSKNVQMPSSTTPIDEIHQTDRVANNEIKKPHEQEMLANDAISDQGKFRQVNLNEQICPAHETIGDPKDGFVGCSTSNIVDWVGDSLKAVNNKTYYNSCNIDDIIYSLHDHILIASEGSKVGPCKLQSMWQEDDSGSRLAMVNPYLFRSDIPEFISKPCTDEENEVYGSNDEIIVLLTAIRGPCEVLHVDRVREETKRKCQLDGSRSRLHPIFFCRWKYDESTDSFYKDYNVDN